MTYKKKLIEVALPLEAINKECAREKSIRHGHPCTLHLWWARRPLAACRAVLFASLVDDPSSRPEEFPTEDAQEKERERLFSIIERLVKWENSNDEQVLAEARAEILRSTDGNPPPVLDPFCGGGSIPLEAQRLGLKAYASDLNPVAVLITKALIEFPPKFAGRPPVNPESRRSLDPDRAWPGATGLAEDVRYYGKWMHDEAEKRIGHLYPKVKLPKECGGGEATVIAWLWARTMKCPNPACAVEMPLAKSFRLSSRKGKGIWARPTWTGGSRQLRFALTESDPGDVAEAVGRQGTTCAACGTPVPFARVREEGIAGRLSVRLMAAVVQAHRGRVYLPPERQHEEMAIGIIPSWRPETELTGKAAVNVALYGLARHGDLFTGRQLVALTTLCDLVTEARSRLLADCGVPRNGEPGDGDSEAASRQSEYADTVATYLGLAVSRTANTLCSLAIWSHSRDQSINVFSRQALAMTWDFPEVNPFAGAAGDFGEACESISKIIVGVPGQLPASSLQLDVSAGRAADASVLVATDPPYYDNISYADLSDFFYVWLRRAIGAVHRDLFSTVLTPKTEELIAAPYRFAGDRGKAARFFENGMGRAFAVMRRQHRPDYPLTLFYAFKQSEASADEEHDQQQVAATRLSTGWETMLDGLLRSGLAITGTWPLRTERPTGVKVGMNVLASSIVLACRPRPDSAELCTRREFVAALRRELPDALLKMIEASIAPVDLAQASIGPGMAVFSRYAKVLEADGSPMSVRTALQIINQELDAHLAAQEGEMDADTRFCVAWFEQYGVSEGPFGEADVLARAKNTAVSGLVEAGVADSRSGKVRLLQRSELPEEWDPIRDQRLTIWEAAQHLIRRLEEGGEDAAGALCARLGSWAANAHSLAYRLYNICERKGWADEARAYNSLVVSWPSIQEKAAQSRGDEQTSMDL